MSATAKALYEEAGKLVHQARTLIDEWDGKAMPADVQNQLDALFDEIDAKKGEADELKKAAERKNRLNQLDQEFGQPLGERIAVGVPEAKDGGAQFDSKEDLALFRKWVWGGATALDQIERKALQVTDDTMGGFLTVPMIFRNELIQKVDDIVVMRGISTVFQLQQAESVGV